MTTTLPTAAPIPGLRAALLGTRLLVALFLLPWILMRFTQPEAAQNVAESFYGPLGDVSGIGTTIIGVLWLVLWLAFVAGFKKRISYGLVLLLHTVGTLTTIPNLIPGGDGFQILFYAALPTIGAMWLLYVLRDQDTLLSVG